MVEPESSVMAPKAYILMIGTPLDGYRFFGPFDDHEDPRIEDALESMKDLSMCAYVMPVFDVAAMAIDLDEMETLAAMQEQMHDYFKNNHDHTEE
jgi:hypothetical protein